MDETAEEEVVIPNEVPVGGGLLWIKLRSARDLETKKSGYPNHFVVLKFRGQEQKSAVSSRDRFMNSCTVVQYCFMPRPSARALMGGTVLLSVVPRYSTISCLGQVDGCVRAQTLDC